MDGISHSGEYHYTQDAIDFPGLESINMAALSEARRPWWQRLMARIVSTRFGGWQVLFAKFTETFFYSPILAGDPISPCRRTDITSVVKTVAIACSKLYPD